MIIWCDHIMINQTATCAAGTMYGPGSEYHSYYTLHIPLRCLFGVSPNQGQDKNPGTAWCSSAWIGRFGTLAKRLGQLSSSAQTHWFGMFHTFNAASEAFFFADRVTCRQGLNQCCGWRSARFRISIELFLRHCAWCEKRTS